MNKIILLIGIILLAGIVMITMNTFKSSKSQESSMNEMNAEDFKQKVEADSGGVVIDVRTLDEYKEGHLALVDYHFDLLNGDFENHLDSLDKTQTYFLYCRSGNRSGKAAKLMEENGFKNVYNIGGFQNLVKSGLEEE